MFLSRTPVSARVTEMRNNLGSPYGRSCGTASESGRHVLPRAYYL